MNAEIIGSVAAALTTLSFVPQAVRVLRTGDTEAISLAMYSMFVVGIALWELYGLLIGSWPVIVANIVTFALSGLILVQKIRHERKKARA